MKILDPNNTTHLIVLQPRTEPTTTLVLELKNEVTKVLFELDNTYTYVGGVLNISFDLDVLESDRFLVEVRQEGKIIYNGKVFCTSQEPQDYKLTEGNYKYA